MSPYQASVGYPHEFGEHRHADIEINYCVKGSFEVVVNKQKHEINEGEFALIGPMRAHSFPASDDKQNKKRLTLIVGVTFLKNSFSYFTNMKNDIIILGKDEDSEAGVKLRELLDETAELCKCKKAERNDLLLRGNLYKICAYLIEIIKSSGDVTELENKEMRKVANIEKALEMIYYDHASPLTLEDAASATGYGKSNFCKIFKEITGDTFHNVLNRQRIQSACDLLEETNMPISDIALQVGFGEAKTFCRIFRSITDMTPREYRKKHK